MQLTAVSLLHPLTPMILPDCPTPPTVHNVPGIYCNSGPGGHSTFYVVHSTNVYLSTIHIQKGVLLD